MFNPNIFGVTISLKSHYITYISLKYALFLQFISLILISEVTFDKKKMQFQEILISEMLKVIEYRQTVQYQALSRFCVLFGKVQFWPNVSQFYPILASGEDFSTKVQLLYIPWVEPIQIIERAGSKVLFDTKTFTCDFVNFCSIGITIQPILCENYIIRKI